MNLPFSLPVAIFFKEKHRSYQVISAISVVGVAIATMALVVILSVFNGFHDLVASLFTNFDPQIQVVPAVGKTIPADAISIDKIKENANKIDRCNRVCRGYGSCRL